MQQKGTRVNNPTWQDPTSARQYGQAATGVWWCLARAELGRCDRWGDPSWRQHREEGAGEEGAEGAAGSDMDGESPKWSRIVKYRIFRTINHIGQTMLHEEEKYIYTVSRIYLESYFEKNPRPRTSSWIGVGYVDVTYVNSRWQLTLTVIQIFIWITALSWS